MIKRRLILLSCLFGLSLSLIMSSQAQAASDFVVPLSRSELITLPEEADEIIISDPNIADIFVHGKTRISVIGKALGKTSLRAFNAEGKVIKDLDVQVSYDLPAIRRAIKNFFPNENLSVELVNDNVALTGTVTDAITSERAVKIAEEFVNEGRGVDAATPPKILNLAQIRSGQQVMLHVRVGEIQRNTLKNMGIDLSMLKNAGNFSYIFSSAAALDDVFGAVNATYTSGANTLSATLNALEEEGLFKVLAEPNLVAISGEKAEFLAGGEFPIPVSQQDDTITIEFKQFGVSTQFTPFVLSPDRIRLIVQPEVSELSDAGAIQLQSITIPSITARRVKTTVELAPGESFMIAGLISDRANTKVRSLPGVAEVPILSALFRSSEFERVETELVIAVTPYLVDPVAGKDIRTPADNLRHASMMESMFFGALGASTEAEMRASQTPSLEGPLGFMTE